MTDKEKVPHTIRFPKRLHSMLRLVANKQGRSFNAQVIFILERYVYEHGGVTPEEVPFSDLRTK